MITSMPAICVVCICVECKGRSSFRTEICRISKCFKTHLIPSSQSFSILFLLRIMYNLTHPQPKLGRSQERKYMEICLKEPVSVPPITSFSGMF